MNCVVGKRYRLLFENTPEGEIECAGLPLVFEGICTDSDSVWMCFEQELENNAECCAFFQDAPDVWADENGWTRLLSATEIPAPAQSEGVEQ